MKSLFSRIVLLYSLDGDIVRVHLCPSLFSASKPSRIFNYAPAGSHPHLCQPDLAIEVRKHSGQYAKAFSTKRHELYKCQSPGTHGVPQDGTGKDHVLTNHSVLC